MNAIPSSITAWLDARGASAANVRALIADLDTEGCRTRSWTEETPFDLNLNERIRAVLPTAPVLATGAGHDAGILANAGIPAAMLFVRNPTGISHSPAEFAERDDCLAGVDALAAVLTALAG